MDSLLPATGTSALLDLLNPHIPDDFINEQWSRRPARGPRCKFSPAQLWRLHLLTLLTPVHAFNLLLDCLPEQRQWRSFAHLPNQRDLPDVRMLHNFRARLGVAGLRQINEFLRRDLMEQAAGWDQSVALIDATDLPASCSGFKKKLRGPIPPSTPVWADAPSRPGKAVALSVTRSTRCVCGGDPIGTECCSYHWSVG
jgi:hypothetical protein